MNKKILLVIAVFAAAALTARAQNLVTNPGFETGDFTGWTPGGETDETGVGTSDPTGNPLPHSGNFLAFMGPFTETGTLSQTLTAGAGLFNVDFYLAASGGGAGDFFSASLGGTTISTTNGNGAFGYIHIVIDNVAAGANPVLQFSAFNAPAWWDVDDVTVTAVPEPGTLGLIGLGALGLLAALRKRLV
jgi:PEP-CTERM motif